MYLNLVSESDAIEAEEMDALDAFMCTIKSGSMDMKTKMSLKRTLVELRREQMRLQKLVNIAKPILPALKKYVNIYCHQDWVRN